MKRRKQKARTKRIRATRKKALKLIFSPNPLTKGQVRKLAKLKSDYYRLGGNDEPGE